jgi:hypothetical protein
VESGVGDWVWNLVISIRFSSGTQTPAIKYSLPVINIFFVTKENTQLLNFISQKKMV